MYLHLIKLTAGSSWLLFSGGGQSGGHHAAAQGVVQRQCCRRGRFAVFGRSPLRGRAPWLHRPPLRRLRVAPRRHRAAGGGGGVAGRDGSRRAHRPLFHRRRAHRRLPPPPAPRRRRRRRRRRGAPRAGRRADAAVGPGRAAARRRAVRFAVARSGGGSSRRQQRVAAAGAPAVAQPVGGAAAADAAAAVAAGATTLFSRQLAFARFRRHGGRWPHAVPVLRRNAWPRFSFDFIRFRSRNIRGGCDGMVWRVAPLPAGAAPPRPLQLLRLWHHAPALPRGGGRVARVTRKEAAPVCNPRAPPTAIAPSPRRPNRPPRSFTRRRPRCVRRALGARAAPRRSAAWPPPLRGVFRPRARRAARRASLGRGCRCRVLRARVRPFVDIRCSSAQRRPLPHQSHRSLRSCRAVVRRLHRGVRRCAAHQGRGVDAASAGRCLGGRRVAARNASQLRRRVVAFVCCAGGYGSHSGSGCVIGRLLLLRSFFISM